jgi:hypothetical protein
LNKKKKFITGAGELLRPKLGGLFVVSADE